MQFDKTMIKRHNVQELCREYRKAKKMVEEAYLQLHQAEKILQAASGDQYLNTLPGGHYHDSITEKIISDIDKRIWGHVIDLLGVRKLLSIQKAEELNDRLRDGKFPEITEDNIYNTFLIMMNQAGDFAEEAIREVYDWLRPRKQHYKTNSKWKVGKKVIKYGVELIWEDYRVIYHYQDQYNALDRVFHILDGQPAGEDHYSDLVNAINLCTEEDNTAETEYFSVKCYKNGNVHITFKRPDLVQEFNRVAGGSRLKEPA